MSAGLDSALAKIDEAIIALFRERERLVSIIDEESATQSSSAPFVVPFAVGVKRRVQPFEELAPGFWFGYPPTFKPLVTVTQTAEADYLLSPPNHHFTVTFEIEDTANCSWMTIEKLVGRVDPSAKYRLTIALKAKASKATSVKFELSVPQVDAEDHRFPLGSLTLSREYEAAFLSQAIDISEVPAPNPKSPSKVIAFLPEESGSRITLAYYNTLLTKQ